MLFVNRKTVGYTALDFCDDCRLVPSNPEFTPSRSPGTLSVQIRGYLISGNKPIFRNLEINHTHTYEIGPVCKSVLEAFARMDSTRRQYLECNPRLFHLLHEFDGPLRANGPHIIVIVGTAAVDIKFYSFLFRRSGPIIAVVQSLHVKINIDSRLFDCNRHFNRMAADAGD